jgi:hypothetical protein
VALLLRGRCCRTRQRQGAARARAGGKVTEFVQAVGKAVRPVRGRAGMRIHHPACASNYVARPHQNFAPCIELGTKEESAVRAPAPLSCMTCRQRAACFRGVCPRCYRRYRHAVVGGKTTWQALEAAGLVLPPQPKGKAWSNGWATRPSA